MDPNSNRLTEAGLSYSLELAKYIYARQETVTDLSKDVFVLAGTTEVHAETILHLRNIFPCYHTTLLNEIRAGEVRRPSEVTWMHPLSQLYDCALTFFTTLARYRQIDRNTAPSARADSMANRMETLSRGFVRLLLVNQY